MENSVLRLANTLFFCLIILETSCEHSTKYKRSDYDYHDWFPNFWAHEYVGRTISHEIRPQPPRSPFHPEELPIGLRFPFPGFGDTIYERVVRPYVHNNFVSRQYNAKNDAEKTALFRHEVENIRYQPEVYHTQKSRPGRANHQKEMSTSKRKLNHSPVPQPRGIGDLPLSDPRKPILYSDLVFNP